MKNVMLDLETLGTGANAAITQIGAVEFDPDTKRLGRAFFAQIGVENAAKTGDVDGSTLAWWLKQSDAARAAMCEPGYTMEGALRGFYEWLVKDAYVWGNGAAFDNAILASAYRRMDAPLPWAFWNDRCYRTLKELSPTKPVVFSATEIEAMGLELPSAVAHHALYDAAQQAANAIHMLWRIRWVG